MIGRGAGPGGLGFFGTLFTEGVAAFLVLFWIWEGQKYWYRYPFTRPPRPFLAAHPAGSPGDGRAGKRQGCRVGQVAGVEWAPSRGPGFLGPVGGQEGLDVRFCPCFGSTVPR